MHNGVLPSLASSESAITGGRIRTLRAPSARGPSAENTPNQEKEYGRFFHRLTWRGEFTGLRQSHTAVETNAAGSNSLREMRIQVSFEFGKHRGDALCPITRLIEGFALGIDEDNGGAAGDAVGH